MSHELDQNEASELYNSVCECIDEEYKNKQVGDYTYVLDDSNVVGQEVSNTMQNEALRILAIGLHKRGYSCYEPFLSTQNYDIDPQGENFRTQLKEWVEIGESAIDEVQRRIEQIATNLLRDKYGKVPGKNE